MASTLFFEVAHRAAFDFDEEDFVFDDGLLALDDFDVLFALAGFAFVLPCFDLTTQRRLRYRGKRLTSSIASVLPMLAACTKALTFLPRRKTNKDAT